MARWFGPKKFGYGVGPRGWQGWLVTAIFIGLLFAVRLVVPEEFGYPRWTRKAAITAIIVVYLILAYFKYEPDPKPAADAD